MAVYTDIHQNDLKKFLTRYSIGSLLSYQGIAEGIENSNFMLYTTEGKFILTLYEKRISKGDLPFFCSLMQHLGRRGIPCPQPVIQSDGTIIGELAGRPAAIITFLEGMWVRQADVYHCCKVGSSLAQLHLAGQDFSLNRRNTLSLVDWKLLWENCQTKEDMLLKEFGRKIDTELAFLEKNWPSNLPTGIIHADLFNDNVFFLNRRLSGIIDFYFACTDFWAYDLAICLNAWCFEQDHSYNLAKARGLLENYQKIRSLTPLELNAIVFLVRGAALRFLLTRLYDWFNTPPGSFVVKKDPWEYWHKLCFFSNVSSLSELGF
ncbi:Homoserine kinase [Candidatus Bartonella washoeensis]|uniref:Homoserine kinase n=1 Tax=Candidatus Bartonella washoeensis Sb944nv TaxID=1094563 RepID=J0Z263_9HYPH|nr:homoserine kinase [Bartonella washoeensis]EJF81523.1 homoserine kinase [Bartonella washoeensis Sb944nv]SPU28080.1 Homoserine kinase [Bartonella washoeensis]